MEKLVLTLCCKGYRGEIESSVPQRQKILIVRAVKKRFAAEKKSELH